LKKKDKEVRSIISDMLYQYKQTESIKLAGKVSSQTSKFLRTKNLGRKHAQFFVLKNTVIPAVLIEVGFLSNPKEEDLLKTTMYRQKIANGLARSILDYIDD
jgi:N-acetylmuramoyl-L-alanine amidase